MRLVGVSMTAAGVSVEAEGQSSARCPACGRRSRARHSRYWRTLKDLAVHKPSPQEYVAVNDSFGESGTPDQLLKKYGLDAPDIVKAVQRVLERK